MSSFSRMIGLELTDDILPFWIYRMQDPHGGFYGRMDGKGNLEEDAVKGAILNARILWTFASAYRVCGKKEYLDMALRAKGYILKYFIDHEYGGVYWSLTSKGEPHDTHKQFYALSFVIYGMSELYRANGDKEALDCAIQLFHCIEEHSRDSVKAGYIEATARDWQPIADMRLSDKDQNDAKTMNTHLHILEAYTSLYRVWKDEALAASLEDLVRIFLDRILRPDGHLGLFFDEDWNSTSGMFSYGHDIEASWLLCEAAEVLGREELLKEVRERSTVIAQAALEGYDEMTGMIYEYDPSSGHKDTDRHWWVQAEAVVGFYNQFQITGEEHWREKAILTWAFIHKYLLAPSGEWYWSVVPAEGNDFRPNTVDDRAGFWKCPYHNGRMCMEVMERIG